jgi:hypothetical protein
VATVRCGAYPRSALHISRDSTEQSPTLSFNFKPLIMEQTRSGSEEIGSSIHDRISRRQFLSRSATAASTSVLAGVSLPAVHAAEDSTIRLALIGCGGRGCGAVSDAFDSKHGPVKLVAMGDLFSNRVENAWQVLSEKFSNRVEVPPERRFVGFDAYRKAIDSLRSGDVAMLTGVLGFSSRATRIRRSERCKCVHGEVLCAGRAGVAPRDAGW